jgi:hypothetical protein
VKSKILKHSEVSEEYRQQVLDLVYEICRACQSLFNDKNPNLIINAVNKIHADMIFLIAHRSVRALEAAEIEAESLILNVKNLLEQQDDEA